MANKKIPYEFNGKWWPINRAIVQYYCFKIPLPQKRLYAEIDKRSLKKTREGIDPGGITKALKRGTIAPKTYCLMIEIIKEHTTEARKEERDDLDLIPVPTDLVRWPNKEMEADYRDIMGNDDGEDD